MRIILKDEFIKRFKEDQKDYRKKTGFYETITKPNGKIFFNINQLYDIQNRFNDGESMTSIGKSYECSRQTIRENLKSMGEM